MNRGTGSEKEESRGEHVWKRCAGAAEKRVQEVQRRTITKKVCRKWRDQLWKKGAEDAEKRQNGN